MKPRPDVWLAFVALWVWPVSATSVAPTVAPSPPPSVDRGLLTLGAEPRQLSASAGEYVRFMIDIVNDYCSKSDSLARQLCMATPQAKVTVTGCRGESWLLVNPTKPSLPLYSTAEFISRRGNQTNFIEVSEFEIVQAQTHLAVFNPRGTTSTFRIWVVNTNDRNGKVTTITPLLRPGDNVVNDIGRLIPQVAYSHSIFRPSTITLSWYYANKTDNSGAVLPDQSLEYRMYYIRLGDIHTPMTATKNPHSVMSSACGVLMNGVPHGNWSNTLESSLILHLDGGLYIFNVLARPAGEVNWLPANISGPTGCTSPCLVGAFEPLPYLWEPYKPIVGTDTQEFGWALSTLLSAVGILGCIIAAGFYHVYDRAKRREEAQELVEMQQKRRAAIERGEKYVVSKKRRQLSLWERLTGEVVTRDDEEYDDCLNPEERRKIELFHRNELGADSEWDQREIPSV